VAVRLIRSYRVSVLVAMRRHPAPPLLPRIDVFIFLAHLFSKVDLPSPFIALLPASPFLPALYLWSFRRLGVRSTSTASPCPRVQKACGADALVRSSSDHVQRQLRAPAAGVKKTTFFGLHYCAFATAKIWIPGIHRMNWHPTPIAPSPFFELL
jgi:hypothetical protein